MAGDNTKIALLVVMFLVIILGAISSGIIGDQILAKTDKTASTYTADLSTLRNTAGSLLEINQSNHNVTLTYAPSSWRLDDSNCYISNVVVRNASTTFTVNTDYVVNAKAGKIGFLNTSTTMKSPNTTYVDYKYCGDDYMTSSFGRSGLNMVTGFFALFILIIIVGGVYMIIRQFKE